jgi:hypothetical protein
MSSRHSNSTPTTLPNLTAGDFSPQPCCSHFTTGRRPHLTLPTTLILLSTSACHSHPADACHMLPHHATNRHPPHLRRTALLLHRHTTLTPVAAHTTYRCCPVSALFLMTWLLCQEERMRKKNKDKHLGGLPSKKAFGWIQHGSVYTIHLKHTRNCLGTKFGSWKDTWPKF